MTIPTVATKEWLDDIQIIKEPYCTFIKQYEQGIVPESVPWCSRPLYSDRDERYFDDSMSQQAAKCAINERISWALITMDWVRELVQSLQQLLHKPANQIQALEIMAGRGWLAKALSQLNVNVLATDLNPQPAVHEVSIYDAADAVDLFADSRDVLIICWPHFISNADACALKLWPKEKPIIYIGEGEGGCTGSLEFHAMFKSVARIEISQYWDMYDACYLGYRR